VLRPLIVRKPEKVVPTPVAPPPAEVEVEPIEMESETVAEPAALGNREES
jgi:hypothetical protein